MCSEASRFNSLLKLDTNLIETEPYNCLDRKNIKTTKVEHQHSWLGTVFFCVLNASFFCIHLKNATFFYILVSNFLRLMKPKRTLRSFALFWKERMPNSSSFFQYIYIYISISIYIYIYIHIDIDIYIYIYIYI